VFADKNKHGLTL